MIWLKCIKCGFTTNNWRQYLTCPNHSPYYSYLDLICNNAKLSSSSVLLEDMTSLKKLSIFSKKNQTVYVKCEYENPTGSIKDREVATIFQIVAKNKIPTVFMVSAGNGAKSAAYYAKKFNIQCTCFVPPNIDFQKKDYLQSLGAKLEYATDDYETLFKKVIDKQFFYNITPGINPFASEGTKHIAYELIQQLSNIKAIVVPVGNGTQLAGIWKGFKELGLVNLPKMIGVEIKGCDTVYQAMKRNKDFYEFNTIPNTEATGIATRASFSAPKAIKAIKESNGEIICISEKELKNTLSLLKDSNLAHIETTSASVLSALKYITVDGNIVCILSGGNKKH